MTNYTQLFIDGKWINSSNEAGKIEVLDSMNNEPFAAVPDGSSLDVDKAVQAAKQAQKQWALTSPAERSALLAAVSKGIEKRSGELTKAISKETGMPENLVEMMQVGTPAYTFESCSRFVNDLKFEDIVGNASVRKEPMGVVACITPWNFPLHQIAAKVAPALAAGCTVVLKPAGLAPVSAFILAEIFEKAKAPAGIFNLVTGKGAEIGDSLVSHPLVDMVSFTGSVETGKHVAGLAGQNLKRVALELGGKSASIVCDRESLEKGVSFTAGSCFLNSGQTCSALTRLLVPSELYDEAAAMLKKIVSEQILGDPADETTTMGPLVSKSKKMNVLEFISSVKEGDAELIAGTDTIDDNLRAANFVPPLVFGKVKSDSKLAQEEIFGPVLSVITYNSEEEAVQIANGTPFGLNCAIWSNDEEKALRMATKMESGQVQINGPSFNPDAPFGGYKASGFGRELGPLAIEEFFQIKAVLKD